jgi:hypothetical protein
LLTTTLYSTAQAVPQAATLPEAQARPGRDWRVVEAVPAGTHLYVEAKAGHKSCTVKSVSADALTCGSGAKEVVYPRTEISTLKMSRRGRSALFGAIPGGVLIAAGGIGAATEKCGDQSILCGIGPAILVAGGIAFAVVGATVGGLTDFGRSTIYKAP